MREGRWTTVTESQFQHERSGLLYLKERLPGDEPYRAWSNFTFTANTGHVREVDLLVAAPAGLYLIELKAWQGAVSSSGASWVQTMSDGRRRVFRNPRHLANQKAKELKGLLKDAMQRAGIRRPVPYVQELVFFTEPGLRVNLAANDLAGVVGKDGHATLPDVLAEIQRPAHDVQSGIDPQLSKRLGTLFDSFGIGRSDAEFHVGTYRLDRKPFDTGPNWADYLGHHDSLRRVRRVRLYLRERGGDRQARESISHTAQREARVLQGLAHPGLVTLENFDESGHSAGPALVYEYDPRTLRLDDYLVQYGDKLGARERAAILRHLAETLNYAHRHRLYHRTLCARAVHVRPGPRHRGESDEQRWLRPRLQIAEWQTAVRRGSDSATGGSGFSLTSGHEIVPSNNVAAYVSEAADPYLAPELTARAPDPVALDVFGLGVLGYLLFTGKAPASSQAALTARLEQGNGLAPSSLVDGLSGYVDELIQAATAYGPARRTRTVAEFLEMLDSVDLDLAEPTDDDDGPATAPAEESDPLEARPGELVGGRFRIKRSLGQGSTSRALLAEDTERGNAPVVLKIARKDDYAKVLRRESAVLAQLRNDSKVIRPALPEPIVIGPRTVLVLDHAGDRTVARQLREEGRLLPDQLATYSTYLFAAVDFLEGEGVWHRDLKPDNIAIRVRPNGTKQLVLFDFSLANAPVDQITSGTDGYLDPFVGIITRGRYDAHAEWYALAVTLHEMASGELPIWGDGKSIPRQTDAKQWPCPLVAAEAFDPSLRDGLSDFFRRALHRDVRHRFPGLQEMQKEWQRVLLLADQPAVGRPSKHPEAIGELPADESADETAGREEAAAQAKRDTSLAVSGLSQRAVSFLNNLNLNTIGELLDYSTRRLVNQPGLGARTRDEINARLKQWRLAFHAQQPSPLSPAERGDSAEEVAEARADQQEAGSTLPLRRLSLDALVTLLVPKPTPKDRNATEVEATRLLLRLPDEQGSFPDALPSWPLNKSVAPLTSEQVTEGRIAQILGEQRKRWIREQALVELRNEIIEVLTEFGRIASATELAETLVAKRGTMQADPAVRAALGLAATRAAYEVDWALTPRRLRGRRHGDSGDNVMLIALEVDEDTDRPETPSGPSLLDYADRLGKAAESLAGRDTLASPSTVLEQVVAADDAFHAKYPDVRITLDEARTVTLAAAAGRDAAANARLEIYSRDLPPVRALRLTQAGLILPLAGAPDHKQQGLTVENIHDRVRARFPELRAPLPDHYNPLGKLLRQAGFEVQWRTDPKTKRGHFYPKRGAGTTDPTSVVSRRNTTRGTRLGPWAAQEPELEPARRADAQLLLARDRPGFRVLTVGVDRYQPALEELIRPGGQRGRFTAEPVNVSALYLRSLHHLVDARPKPTWETILKADIAEPGSRGALKFAEYTAAAWGEVERRLTTALTSGAAVPGSGDADSDSDAATEGHRPLLLHDAAVLARYGGMGVLQRISDLVRSGGPRQRGLWILSSTADPTAAPWLDGKTVPLQDPEEWIRLVDDWVANRHRSDQKSGGRAA